MRQNTALLTALIFLVASFGIHLCQNAGGVVLEEQCKKMNEKVCCECGKALKDEFVFVGGKFLCVKCFKNSKR